IHEHSYALAKLLRRAHTERLQKLLGEFWQTHLLYVLDFQRGLDRLTPHTRIGDGIEEPDIKLPRVTRLRFFDRLAEPVRDAILQQQSRIDADRHFFVRTERSISHARAQVADQVVP